MLKRRQLYENDDVAITIRFPCSSLSQTPIVYGQRFLPRSLDEKELTHFQSEIAVLKFLWRILDGKHLTRFQSENGIVFKFRRRR